VLSKRFSGELREDAKQCRGQGAVSELRRAYLQVPEGRHVLTATVRDAGPGRVAARVFRETTRKTDSYVAFTPETYTAVNHVQFASGNQSAYYLFDAATPLGFAVTGPTTLKIYVRLDFDHTMNGAQDFALEVYCDGAPWRRFNYHTEKLSSAVYVERADVLPGARQLLRVAVPEGPHRYEIRCVRPEACGVAARIRIPRSAVGGR
jgi:hypothetical protein